MCLQFGSVGPMAITLCQSLGQNIGMLRNKERPAAGKTNIHWLESFKIRGRTIACVMIQKRRGVAKKAICHTKKAFYFKNCCPLFILIVLFYSFNDSLLQYLVISAKLSQIKFKMLCPIKMSL